MAAVGIRLEIDLQKFEENLLYTALLKDKGFVGCDVFG